MFMKQVGEQLRRARIAAGLTQRELAARADKSHQLVEKVENGQNTTIETLDQLVRATGAELVVRVDSVVSIRHRGPPLDRLAVAGRLMAILPRLPDSVVDGLLHDIALWESEYVPDPDE
jgi:transcriptional regulator with XRE-family HTH domain